MFFPHLLASHKASGGHGHLSSLTSDPQLQLCAGGHLRCPLSGAHMQMHTCKQTGMYTNGRDAHLITLPAIMQYSDGQVLPQTESENTLPVCARVCVLVAKRVSSLFPL